MGAGHEGHFIGSAERSRPDEVLKASSGAELLALLSRYSSQKDPITKLSIYSHGYHRGIVMKTDEGFYNNQYMLHEILAFFGIWESRDIDDSIKLIDSGDIVFSKDSTVKLFGCNNATGKFAQRLSDATGATVIAGRGKVSPINKDNKDTGWFSAGGGFYKHRPNSAPKRIGKRLWGRYYL